MQSDNIFPVLSPAIRVEQPLGAFYVTKLSAGLLLQVAYADPLRAIAEADLEGRYPLLGAQREESLKRRREIGRYIDTVEAAFPNSIILAANFHEDGTLEEDEDLRWRIEERHDNCLELIIPSSEVMASIVDGQHRLFGFHEITNSNRLSMELLCAVYLDLPNPYQAYLFATINFNQKKVDRSLAYELFGFNLDEEIPESWSPEKAAVFLCRKLNTDPESPFYRRVIVAAQNDDILLGVSAKKRDWSISTATIVDGILRLISSNPKKDRDAMHTMPIRAGRERSMLDDDKTPFRRLYRKTNDVAIYTAVRNFFIAVRDSLWSERRGNSYIIKTVGIQASFDILRIILVKHFEHDKDISIKYFKEFLARAISIDFSHEFFQASGKGRTRIKNSIAFAARLITQDSLPENDREMYLQVVAEAK